MRTFIFLIISIYIQASLAQGKESFTALFPEFANLGINAKVEKITSTRMEPLYYEEDKYYLSVQMGRLSQQQFNALIKYYGARSSVAYDPNRHYDLIDFLPPSIQAVANQTFTPIRYEFASLYETSEYDSLLEGESESGMDFWALKKNGLGTQTNCWNTTFENINAILFKKTNYRLSLPPRWNANDEVDTNSQLIQPEDIRLWDMLVVRENSEHDGDFAMLMHTAIYLNQNVVFEKTDSTENDAYRLSLVKDVYQKYEQVFEDRLVIEQRRVSLPFFENQLYMTDPVILAIIQRYHPNLETPTIITGCETGLGGGCDMYHTLVESMEIITYKKTGRGILKGPRRVLDQFSPL